MVSPTLHRKTFHCSDEVGCAFTQACDFLDVLQLPTGNQPTIEGVVVTLDKGTCLMGPSNACSGSCKVLWSETLPLAAIQAGAYRIFERAREIPSDIGRLSVPSEPILL